MITREDDKMTAIGHSVDLENEVQVLGFDMPMMFLQSKPGY